MLKEIIEKIFGKKSRFITTKEELEKEFEEVTFQGKGSFFESDLQNIYLYLIESTTRIKETSYVKGKYKGILFERGDISFPGYEGEVYKIELMDSCEEAYLLSAHLQNTRFIDYKKVPAKPFPQVDIGDEVWKYVGTPLTDINTLIFQKEGKIQAPILKGIQRIRNYVKTPIGAYLKEKTLYLFIPNGEEPILEGTEHVKRIIDALKIES